MTIPHLTFIMRAAVISDIHSNLQALLKTFALIDKLGVDNVYCLGDIVGYGGNPNECVHLVRERSSGTVLGNHDLAALDPAHAAGFTEPGKIAAEWTNKALEPENRAFLAGLPYKHIVPPLTLVHANPSHPDRWAYLLTLEDVVPQFEHFSTEVCFVGHSHVPSVCGDDLKTFAFEKGRRYVINVGSVGQPRDRNPQLSFGLIDTDAWTYENIRDDYDIRGAADSIRDRGLPRALSERLYVGG